MAWLKTHRSHEWAPHASMRTQSRTHIHTSIHANNVSDYVECTHKNCINKAKILRARLLHHILFASTKKPFQYDQALFLHTRISKYTFFIVRAFSHQHTQGVPRDRDRGSEREREPPKRHTCNISDQRRNHTRARAQDHHIHRSEFIFLFASFLVYADTRWVPLCMCLFSSSAHINEINTKIMNRNHIRTDTPHTEHTRTRTSMRTNTHGYFCVLFYFILFVY